MRKTMWMAASLVVALAACGKSANQGNQSGTAPAAAAAADVQMQPGEWEMVVETVNVSGTALPPNYAEAMKGHKVTRRHCITPEEAAHPMRKMMESQQKGQCDFKGLTIANGQIQGSATCGGGNRPGKMTMSMNGQFDAQSFAYTSKISNEGPGMTITIESRAAGHRVGECPAGAKDEEK